MVMACNGLAKLVEECGELQQIAGKKMTCPNADLHYDGKSLKDRMEKEMGDVLAAIELVIVTHSLNATNIRGRMANKLRLFEKWHSDPNA